MLRTCAAFAFLLIFSNQKTAACGYSFIGDCSSSIFLSINGTVDSFAVAACPDVLRFDGFALGSLQSLSLVRAKAATWESCQNNVSGVGLWYRVREQGGPGGAWQSFDLLEDYNTLVGPYTTRYRSANTNISLTSALTVGKIYVLEIYFRAEVDTIGDDFIPETTLLQNNNGQYYHLTFQYGGASAPPFVVATTKVVNVKCHGDSTGAAGVGVYGNQAGLFYQWSTGGNNYWILSQIPAGTYSVTVTGVGGYTASDTIGIVQPAAPLSAQITRSGLGCSGAPGQATIAASGGVPPYKYVWSNGQQTATATFSESGAHSVTVTDANWCHVIYPVDIPTQPIVQVNFAVEICEGETYTAAGLNFTAQGVYEFNQPGANGDCDTLTTLTLSVLQRPTVEMEFEITAPFACTSLDPTHLVVSAVTNAEEPAFEWVFDGQVISTADTCHFIVPPFGTAFPNVPNLTVTDNHGCSAQTMDTNIAIVQPSALGVEALVTNPASGLENGAIMLETTGGAPPYSVLWDNGSTSFLLSNLGTGTYCATVTDAHDCTASICETLESSGAAFLFSENSLKIAPNPAAAGQWVEVTFPERLRGGEMSLEILDLQGRTLIRQSVCPPQTPFYFLLPENLPDGTVVVRAAGASGRDVIGKLSVH